MQAELVKHPLQHEWTLWYYEPDKTKKWEENLNLVSTFSTVEDFWSLFTHIKQPTEVKVGSDYSLFKDNIRPMWEDDRNRNGGVWRITLQQRQRNDLDRYWIDTVSRRRNSMPGKCSTMQMTHHFRFSVWLEKHSITMMISAVLQWTFVKKVIEFVSGRRAMKTKMQSWKLVVSSKPVWCWTSERRSVTVLTQSRSIADHRAWSSCTKSKLPWNSISSFETFNFHFFHAHFDFFCVFPLWFSSELSWKYDDLNSMLPSFSCTNEHIFQWVK